MQQQNHLSPTTERRGYKSPADNRHIPTLSSDLQDIYYTTQSMAKQTPVHSPRIKNSIGDWEQDHPTTVKLMMMKEMVMGLLVHHSNQNRQIDQGLNQLLAHLKIMLGCVPKRNQKKRQNTTGQRLQIEMWNQESSQLSLIINRLRQISKTKEIKETLQALEKVHNKIIQKDENVILSNPRFDRSPQTRKSQIFHQKKSSHIYNKEPCLVESQLKELKLQMVILRKQKVKLMMQLNRQIDISNKKSQQIKILNNLLYKKGLKPSTQTNINSTPSRLGGIDRCRSNPKDGIQSQRSKEYQLMIKDQQILALVNQNKSLKAQIKQLKDVPFTDSFLSEAFNFKDQFVIENKQEYEKTISQLKANIFQLQNKVDSAKFSSEEGQKRISFEQTTQGRSMKDKEKSCESRSTYGKIFQLETNLKRQQTIRISLEKQVQFLRAQQKSMTLQINYLKNEVSRLKVSFSSTPNIQQSSRSPTNNQLNNPGFRFRR